MHKKFIGLALIILIFLTGCLENKIAYGLIFKEYKRVENKYVVTFEDPSGEDVNFLAIELKDISWLEEGKKYKVTYDFNDQETHYQIDYVEFYNESLEGENQ